MLYLERRNSNDWNEISFLVGFVNAEQQDSCTLHRSLETHSQTILWNSRVFNILERRILIQMQGFAPLGFSQRYENASKILQTKKSFMSKIAGAVISSFGWRQHKDTCNTCELAKRIELVQPLSKSYKRQLHPPLTFLATSPQAPI